MAFDFYWHSRDDVLQRREPGALRTDVLRADGTWAFDAEAEPLTDPLTPVSVERARELAPAGADLFAAAVE